MLFAFLVLLRVFAWFVLWFVLFNSVVCLDVCRPIFIYLFCFVLFILICLICYCYVIWFVWLNLLWRWLILYLLFLVIWWLLISVYDLGWLLGLFDLFIGFVICLSGCLLICVVVVWWMRFVWFAVWVIYLVVVWLLWCRMFDCWC